MGNVKIVCTLLDGSRVDLTELLRNYAAHALLFLNIRSYSGGARHRKQKSGSQSANNGLVEVIAMDNVDVSLLNIGGTGESMCQAEKVEIYTSRSVPMQVDGEPLLVNPFKMNIEFLNSADMLTKKKTFIVFTKLFSRSLPHPEVEERAARKIESSFKT